ncbi:MAG: hypothetical protein HY931_01370 [Candidatus Falkowbacteria bacterium]|nr:MAG: hypothetical protein HY931_01370 [Candidatus Falkowbacteria bacterium]
MEKPKNHQEPGIKPLIGIIANSTSPSNRLELIAELGEPQDGVFGPLKFSYQDFRGEIIPLDIQPNEILEKSGMIKGRQAMLRAVAYLASQGAKVICFTASTKRLPGRTGQEVRELYPDITFSIGDNLTNVSYLMMIDYFLGNGILDKENDELVVMGAGFLGMQTAEFLLAKNCRRITMISEHSLPPEFSKKINLINSWQFMPSNIKLFFSCSHKNHLEPEDFASYFAADSVILDVAVPPGISRAVYDALPDGASRWDVGDFFLEDLSYQFPPAILSFPRVGFWYGCFTEAVILSKAQVAGENLQDFNFFEINPEAQIMLRGYLEQEQVSLPLINFYQPESLKLIPF